MDTETQFTHAGLQFAVKDVPAAMDFYRQVLGFEVDYADGQPAHYAVVYRDNVFIHLCYAASQPFDLGPGCGFVVVSGLDSLWDRVQSRDADVVQPLRDYDYGHGVLFRGFVIRDPDRNVLRIGELLHHEPSPDRP
jgi:predicted enzyme related to lactoylglutathione lyase